jgi:hypothetical protein
MDSEISLFQKFINLFLLLGIGFAFFYYLIYGVLLAGKKMLEGAGRIYAKDEYGDDLTVMSEDEYKAKAKGDVENDK